MPSQVSRRLHLETPPPADAAWEGVRKWQSSGQYALSAADKLAWLFLWLRSQQGRQRIAVTPAEVAADQNVTSDAGRQRLKNLRQIGLLLVRKEADTRGVWIIELPNPERVAQGLAVKWDAQRVLDFLSDELQDDAEEDRGTGSAAGASAACQEVLSTEEPTEVPRFRDEEPTEVPRPPLLSSRIRIQRASSIFSGSSFSPEDSDPPRASRDEEPRRGTYGGSSAVGRAEEPRRNELPALTRSQGERIEAQPPQAAGTLMAGILARLPSAEQVEQQAKEYAALIVRRVNCPNMNGRSALKIARAVGSGTVRKSAVDDLLDNLDAIRQTPNLEVPASVYFHCGMRIIRSRAHSGESD